MRRILIAVTVDDDIDRNDLADELPFGSDPTVWEWQDFWADARDGVVSAAGDATRVEVAECPSCQEPFDQRAGDCWLSDLHGQRSREGRFMLLAGHRQSFDDPDAFGPFNTYALAVQFAREQVTEGDWDPTGVTLTFNPIKETA